MCISTGIYVPWFMCMLEDNLRIWSLPSFSFEAGFLAVHCCTHQVRWPMTLWKITSLCFPSPCKYTSLQICTTTTNITRAAGIPTLIFILVQKTFYQLSCLSSLLVTLYLLKKWYRYSKKLITGFHRSSITYTQSILVIEKDRGIVMNFNRLQHGKSCEREANKKLFNESVYL